MNKPRTGHTMEVRAYSLRGGKTTTISRPSLIFLYFSSEPPQNSYPSHWLRCSFFTNLKNCLIFYFSPDVASFSKHIFICNGWTILVFHGGSVEKISRMWLGQYIVVVGLLTVFWLFWLFYERKLLNQFRRKFETLQSKSLFQLIYLNT